MKVVFIMSCSLQKNELIVLGEIYIPKKNTFFQNYVKQDMEMLIEMPRILS